jgi:hypothetical protein
MPECAAVVPRMLDALTDALQQAMCRLTAAGLLPERAPRPAATAETRPGPRWSRP